MGSLFCSHNCIHFTLFQFFSLFFFCAPLCDCHPISILHKQIPTSFVHTHSHRPHTGSLPSWHRLTQAAAVGGGVGVKKGDIFLSNAQKKRRRKVICLPLNDIRPASNNLTQRLLCRREYPTREQKPLIEILKRPQTPPPPLHCVPLSREPLKVTPHWR